MTLTRILPLRAVFTAFFPAAATPEVVSPLPPARGTRPRTRVTREEMHQLFHAELRGSKA